MSCSLINASTSVRWGGARMRPVMLFASTWTHCGGWARWLSNAAPLSKKVVFALPSESVITSPGRTRLAGRIRPALDGAFLRQTAIALQKELHPLPAAELAVGARISCHVASVMYSAMPLPLAAANFNQG